MNSDLIINTIAFVIRRARKVVAAGEIVVWRPADRVDFDDFLFLALRGLCGSCELDLLDCCENIGAGPMCYTSGRMGRCGLVQAVVCGVVRWAGSMAGNG